MSETARQLGKSINTEYDRRPTDLVAVVGDIVEQAGENYPDLSVTVDAPDRLVVPAYPSVETALWELVENVGEYAGESPTAEITLRERGESAVITIADDGPGLPDAERDVLQTGTETQLVHGSGLGLWSVYWVAMSHRGDLDIETDGGTRVTLTLPQGESSDDDPDEPQVPRAGDRYETIFDAAPVGLVMLAADGQILEANDRAETLLDCPVEEFAGRPITAVVGSATGPLGRRQLSDGNGRIERDGTALEYVLRTGVGSGQHLLVVQ
nr:ATP-binding protein [Halovenus carboxidivorans]